MTSWQGVDNYNGHGIINFSYNVLEQPKTQTSRWLSVLRTCFWGFYWSSSNPIHFSRLLCLIKCSLVLSGLGWCRLALVSFLFVFCSFSFFFSFRFLHLKKQNRQEKWTGAANQPYVETKERLTSMIIMMKQANKKVTLWLLCPPKHPPPPKKTQPMADLSQLLATKHDPHSKSKAQHWPL